MASRSSLLGIGIFSILSVLTRAGATREQLGSDGHRTQSGSNGLHHRPIGFRIRANNFASALKSVHTNPEADRTVMEPVGTTFGSDGHRTQAVLGATIPLFVFGDSLADNGNNNNLTVPLLDKANFPHNGIDFPGRIATGRFSNGFNGVDYKARFLGFPIGPPPYMSLTEPNQMLHGVNFASAGSGILDTTGPGTISIKAQIENFQKVVQVLQQTLGQNQAKDKITTSIFTIVTANNDLFAHYFATGAANATLNEQFIDNLVDSFIQHLTSLYNLGARNFDISGTGQVGCVPFLLSQNPAGTCIDALNQLSVQYNTAASARVRQLRSRLRGMRYSYSNIYRMTSDLMQNPVLYGMMDTKNACCGGGKFNGEVQCTTEATYCSNRNKYYFWDWFHPTEAIYRITSHLAFFGSPIYSAPINIQQLAMGITLSTSEAS